MMDLFRHRSQSAVSAEDKRKAVSLMIYFTYRMHLKYLLPFYINTNESDV